MSGSACSITFSNTIKRGKNTKCCSEFLTKFEVFGNAKKHLVSSVQWYIFSISTENKKKMEKEMRLDQIFEAGVTVVISFD